MVTDDIFNTESLLYQTFTLNYHDNVMPESALDESSFDVPIKFVVFDVRTESDFCSVQLNFSLE